MRDCLLIIPCFNEAKRLDLEEFERFLSSNESDRVELLFVNDGSTDKTAQLLNAFCQTNARASFLDLEHNLGKAEAIRKAFLENVKQAREFAFYGFIDADLSTPIEEIPRLLHYSHYEDVSYKLIFGSRVKLIGFSSVKRNLFRHYVGRVFATLASSMLKIPIYDTQCGAKLFRSELIEPLFGQPFLSKWMFDIEILFRYKSMRAGRELELIEVPLRKWVNKTGSKIPFHYFFTAPFEMLRIYFRYR